MKELLEHRTALIKEIRGATPYERLCLMDALNKVDELIKLQIAHPQSMALITTEAMPRNGE